ncbi:D-alanine--D-serine ligase VanG [Petralouisia muris]|uniref:D-alanine--D-serine ligase VanG n=1 Tax=Petralouisia muris TaxID=3032872 RepID=UPI002ED27D3F
MKNRKKIAVLFGGCSSEYEVSLQSAYAVITHIDTEQYELVLIGITKTGKWYLYQGDPVNIQGDSWYNEEECIPAVVSPDKELHGILLMKGRETEEISLDGALPILHGRNGEDGTVQGALELAEIPVIGCGTMSSAVCMDKEMAHRLAGEQGVKVPRSYTIPREDLNLMDIKIKGRELGYPLFVKPLRAGSSFGITRVEKAEDLRLAVEHAFEYDSSVILEEMIAGFEVGCAVLGTKELMTGAVDEIELSEGFFDYTEKYTLKTSKIHVPARISPEKAKEIQETAKIIYRGLGCNYFARVDMFLTPSGEIYFNEVNTIPGFTSHSRYPNMMKAAGVSFEELLSRLLELSGRD